MIRKKIIVKGPVLSRSGYGEQSRFALEAIRSREDLFDVYVINIPWGHTGVTTKKLLFVENSMSSRGSGSCLRIG